LDQGDSTALPKHFQGFQEEDFRKHTVGVSIRALLVDCLLVTLMGRIKVGHFGYGEVLG